MFSSTIFILIIIIHSLGKIRYIYIYIYIAHLYYQLNLLLLISQKIIFFLNIFSSLLPHLSQIIEGANALSKMNYFLGFLNFLFLLHLIQ